MQGLQRRQVSRIARFQQHCNLSINFMRGFSVSSLPLIHDRRRLSNDHKVRVRGVIVVFATHTGERFEIHCKIAMIHEATYARRDAPVSNIMKGKGSRWA